MNFDDCHSPRPHPAWTRALTPRTPPPSAQRHAARRLSLPAAMAHRFFLPDAGPDAVVALPVVHRLQPVAAATLDRLAELHADVHRRRALLGRRPGHADLRRVLGAGQTDIRARRR